MPKNLVGGQGGWGVFTFLRGLVGGWRPFSPILGEVDIKQQNAQIQLLRDRLTDWLTDSRILRIDLTKFRGRV